MRCFILWYTRLMQKKVIAYIDASNLKFGVAQSGWEIDHVSFRSWLRDKFGVDEAIFFMGHLPEQEQYYATLKSQGYDIFFKPTVTARGKKTKGNVDGELILHIARNFYESELSKAVLVSGDGDYHCIVEFLKEKGLPVQVISPNKKYLSFLLKRTNVPIIILDEFIEKLKMKRPSDMP